MGAPLGRRCRGEGWGGREVETRYLRLGELCELVAGNFKNEGKRWGGVHINWIE